MSPRQIGGGFLISVQNLRLSKQNSATFCTKPIRVMDLSLRTMTLCVCVRMGSFVSHRLAACCETPNLTLVPPRTLSSVPDTLGRHLSLPTDERRLADEYGAAQERGEVASGRQ
jgi:hypothetical protein